MMLVAWFRRHGVLIGSAIALLVGVALLPVSLPTGDNFTTPNAEPKQVTQELANGATISQEFPATGTAIETISLTFGTYIRKNHGTLQFSLQTNANGAWRTLAARKMSEEDVPDNLPDALQFSPPIPVTPNAPLRILLESDKTATQGVMWWRTLSDFPTKDHYHLRLNGMPTDGTALFQVIYAPTPSRPLLLALRPVAARVTVLLDGAWKGVFLVAIVALVSGVFVLGRQLPD